MKSKCSFKTFVFRKISYPGELTIQGENLVFKSESINDTPIVENLTIKDIKEVKLKKGLFGDTLGVFYNNDWYEFNNFHDEKYNEIFSYLKLNKGK